MPPLTDQLLSRLSNHLAAQMGWHFPPDRWRELESGMQMAARELGITDVTAFANELLTTKLSPQQIEAMISAFTIGETYFFRDPRSCEVLARTVLPELIRARRASERRLRIWSAGCCTGEEAYTLAILLDRLLPDLETWQITLLATDINNRFLHKAAAGRYGEWSFRGAPPWLKERYFRRINEREFELLPRIRSLVTFACLNLVEDPYPSLTSNTNAMDLILCRNVLMYFSAERIAMVVAKFHRSLLANGLLLVSAVETSPPIATCFVLTPFDGVSFYRKKSDDELSATHRVPAASEPAPFTASPMAAPTAATIIRPVARVATPAVPPRVHEQMTPPAAQETAELVTQATTLFERGRYADARNLLLATVESAPNIEKATLLARICANLGDLPAALTWAERAVVLDRTNALSHYLRAAILQEHNKLEDAVIALQRTLYLEPQFVLAHFALGNLELHQGRQESAARHFNNALALLRRCDDNEVLPHSDGMAAGRLKEMIRSMSPADAA